MFGGPPGVKEELPVGALVASKAGFLAPISPARRCRGWMSRTSCALVAQRTLRFGGRQLEPQNRTSCVSCGGD